MGGVTIYMESIPPLSFSINRIEDRMHAVSFDPNLGKGKIIVNTVLVPLKYLDDALHTLKEVFYSGIAVAPLSKVIHEGERIGEIKVPKDKVALLTVCSITICGVVLKKGIPITPRFGGILQIENGTPRRFTDVILYRASTVDPLLSLLSQKLTSVNSVMKTGSGKVLANLHEVIMFAQEDLENVFDSLLDVGFSGILEVGEPNLDVLGVPVERNHFAFSLIGGTNPMAVMEERGIPMEGMAMSATIEFNEMVHVDEL